MILVVRTEIEMVACFEQVTGAFVKRFWNVQGASGKKLNGSMPKKRILLPRSDRSRISGIGQFQLHGRERFE